MLIIPYTCNCASKSTTGQFWWWLGAVLCALSSFSVMDGWMVSGGTSVCGEFYASDAGCV